MIIYSAATERGSRTGNQDSLCITGVLPCIQTDRPFAASGELSGDRMRLFAVCDGIGGAAAGDQAAWNTLAEIGTLDCTGIHGEAEMAERMIAGAQAGHRRVCAMYERLGIRGGCTLTMLGILGDRYVLLNVGDSPAFLWAPDSGLRELSFRHNAASVKKHLGIPPEWGDERQLIHYIGKAEDDVPGMMHLVSGTILPGDRFLVCSDGITDALFREQLAKMLPAGVQAWELVSMAASAEQADNCTAICLEITPERHTA